MRPADQLSERFAQHHRSLANDIAHNVSAMSLVPLDDRQAMTALSRKLEREGDARGLLIALALHLEDHPGDAETTQSIAAHLKAHRRRFLGVLPDHELQLTWRRGFITGASIKAREVIGPTLRKEAFGTAQTMLELFAIESSAKTLTHLDIRGSALEELLHLAELIAIVAPPLRDLTLATEPATASELEPHSLGSLTLRIARSHAPAILAALTPSTRVAP